MSVKSGKLFSHLSGLWQEFKYARVMLCRSVCMEQKLPTGHGLVWRAGPNVHPSMIGQCRWRDILMDYDDNDTQCHNLQLAGEGRSKSSVLKPFDFPKFDFDDSLPANLRLDSLVETEVFLGIQSQEGNRWIEDFSRVSNGIEFSSSAAEACLISRRNNVWFEASSSESVEMLLKSVGQEEMISGETVAKDSNNIDELGYWTKQMETNHQQDDRKDEYVTDSNDFIPRDQGLKNFPVLYMERVMPQIVGTSQFQENMASIHETSSHMGPNAVTDGLNTSIAKGNLFVESEYADNNGVEAKVSINGANFCADEPSDCKTGENSYDPVRLVDTFNYIASNLSPSETHQQVNDLSLESADGLIGLSCDETEQNSSSREAQTGIQIVEQNIDEASIHTGENSLCFVSNVQSAKPGNAVECSSDSVKEASGIPYGESQLQGLQGSDKDVSFTTVEQLGKVEVELLPVSTEINNSFRGSQHEGYFVDGLLQCPAEMGSVNTAYCATHEAEMDCVTQQVHRQEIDQFEDMPEVCYKNNVANPVNTSGSSLILGEEAQLSISKSDSTSNCPVGESSNLAVISSPARLITEQTETEKVKDLCASSRANVPLHPGESVYFSTSDFGGMGHTFEEKVAVVQVNTLESEQDVSVVKEVQQCSVKLPPEMRNTDSENVGTLIIDQSLRSPVAARRASDGEVSVNGKGLEHEMATKTESGKSSNLAVMNEHREEEHKQPSGMSLPIIVKGDGTAMEISTDSSLSSLNRCAQLAIETCNSACEVKVGVALDAAGDLVSDNAGKSALVIEPCNATSRREPIAAEAKYSFEPCSKELDAPPNPLQKISNEGGSAGAVHAGSHEKAIMKSDNENAHVRPSDSHRAACDSPTIISLGDLSHNDRGEQGDGRGSEVNKKFVKNVQSISEALKGKDASGDGSSFTFKLHSLPDILEKENGGSPSPYPIVEMSKSSLVEEGSTTSSLGNMASYKSPRGSDSEMTSGTAGCKVRRASHKGPSKGKTKKVNHVKESTFEKSSGKEDESSNVSLYPFGIIPRVEFAKLQPYRSIEQNNTKISGFVTLPNLPDLNSSTLNNSVRSSSVFEQPFTDMQQIQLRAQIFVYGSLIQGTAPDEPCMVSAFGPSDGGRSVWEPVWRAAVESVCRRKSHSSVDESPLQSHSGTRAHDIVGKQGSQQTRLFTPPFDQPIGIQRGPIMDCKQAASALYPCQTTTGNSAVNTTWPPLGLFPGSWLATPQTSASNASACFSTTSITESVKLTQANDSSGPSPSGMKLVTSSPLVHTGVSTTMFVRSSPLPYTVKGMMSPEQHSTDSNPRKRKKVPASYDLGQLSLLSQVEAEPVVVPLMTETSPRVAVTTPGFLASKIVMSRSAGTVFPIYSVDRLKKSDVDSGKTVTCSEEILSKVAEVNLQAEDAAALAAAAVGHSQGVWSQLVKLRDSGLTSEAEAKLASAAVAIAAAASVAKAAAAAAKIASNAGLQAKLMADEAFLSRISDSAHGEISFKDGHNIGRDTSASILKGDDGTNESNSVLVAAQEAAKRRMEAALAASKQAENLDALVKAAELAAEAVSQAGQIVAMGDSWPLGELIEAGSEGYWKLPQFSSELAVKLNSNNKEQTIADNAEGGADISVKVSRNQMPDGRGQLAMNHRKKLLPKERSDGETVIPALKQDLGRHKSHMAVEMAKSDEMASELEPRSRIGSFQDEDDEVVDGLHENTIMEGCLVEVFKDGDGFKLGWFSARVLTLKDGKAYVSYDDILSEEGSGNLKEWVSLEGEGDKAPRIRNAYPLIGLHLQGTRKRHREVMGEYAWSVGDRVDALIKDCWCEGVVIEKNEKEDMTFTLHFPACGETSVVRAWNLRPSCIWNGGKWIVWSPLGKHSLSYQGDTPQEKRQKKGNRDVSCDLGKPEDPKLLALSASEKVFNVGRNTREESKLNAPRTLRTGLQKERSRVIFGVPRPGRKAKFVDVSKHYPPDRSSKNNETNDSAKFAKYLMPQKTVSPRLRNASKSDSKEKQPVKSKAKVPSIRKPHGVSSRIVPRRDNLVTTLVARLDDCQVKDNETFNTEDAAEGPSCSFTHRVDGSLKKISSSSKFKWLSSRKAPSSEGKLTKIKEEKVYNVNPSNSVPEAVEPSRRSKRRIQPTHRLLEGLQSSSIASKNPSISQEKGHSSSRNSSSKAK
ncbi:hypothetical protein Nepgr_030749 [Nepenthes gracilis]|uniref:Agenet domain-containing protein n=1 Tax=Nepenthes gracilis TaxID=150966 RepID=A0AAD3Y6V8_NEPGR|nr:hypothetical protein Nepgr_030749 [Nepenthes gracilis]